ncbi:hypothetical protein OROGR_021002 [Orobanche gracilis]
MQFSMQLSFWIIHTGGGWETDETMDEAAARETKEEAGVKGSLGGELGVYDHGNKAVVHMFPLRFSKKVKWSEKKKRTRKWVSVEEARDSLCHDYMKEALDALVSRLFEAAVPGSNNFDDPSAAGQVSIDNQDTHGADDPYMEFYHPEY